MNQATNPNVVLYPDAESMAIHAARHIARNIEEAIRKRGKAMVALAGGTTPEKTYQQLAINDFGIDWSHVYLFLSDERFVPAEDPRSNFNLIQRVLLNSVAIPLDHVFPVPTDERTAAEAAGSYTKTLRKEFEATSKPPRFDLILLGMGNDGHTASLFPGASSLAVEDQWVVAAPPGSLPPPVERITFTYPLLNAAREIVFLVSGEQKAPVLKTVLEGNALPETLPAAGVHPTDGVLTWIVDNAAAERTYSPS